MQYKESLDDSGSLKSLIVKLRALGLRLRAGGNIERQLEFAAKDENLTEEREKINRRGIVLAAAPYDYPLFPVCPKWHAFPQELTQFGPS